MDNSDIRKANLIRLLKDFSTQREFAELVETPTSYITQIIKGTLGKNGKPVSLGNTVARRIEDKLQLERGYMDKEHIETNGQLNETEGYPKPPTGDAVYISPIKLRSSYENKNVVRIPVHETVKASCGDGVSNFLEEITGYVEIDPDFLRMMGIRAKPEKLRIIYSTDYSMWPTVAPDSPLFVDITPIDTTMLINGDVYVFLHNNYLRMKRIFISYGNEKTVRLQSDNPDKNKYPDEVITKDQLNELRFVGHLESALVRP